MKNLFFVLLMILVSTASFARDDLLWRKASNDVNKTLPKQHTSDLTLDSTFYSEGIFVYNYTAIFKKSDIDPHYLKKYHTNSKKIVTNRMCSTRLTRKMLDDGVFVKYIIYDQEGVFLLSITVSVKNCG